MAVCSLLRRHSLCRHATLLPLKGGVLCDDTNNSCEADQAICWRCLSFLFLSLVSSLSFCCLCRLHNSEHSDIRSILSNGQVFSGLLVNGTFSKRYINLFFLLFLQFCPSYTLLGFSKVSNARAVVTIAPLLCHIHFLFSLLVIPSIINCHCRAWSKPITACVAFTPLCNSLYKDVPVLRI